MFYRGERNGLQLKEYQATITRFAYRKLIGKNQTRALQIRK